MVDGKPRGAILEAQEKAIKMCLKCLPLRAKSDNQADMISFYGQLGVSVQSGLHVWRGTQPAISNNGCFDSIAPDRGLMIVKPN